MGDVLEHIATWLAAGLIDDATAARLRAAERAGAGAAVPAPSPVPSLPGDPGHAAAVFGPAVTIGELFGYLGGIFLLGAWAAFVSQLGDERDLGTGLSAAVAAVGVAVAGLALRGAAGPGTASPADARKARAAGVCFLVSTVLATIAGWALAESAGWQEPGTLVVGGAAGVATGALVRRLHPALLTQMALLTSLTVLAAGGLQWTSDIVSPPAGWIEGRYRPRTGPDPIVLVVGQAAWWLMVAVGIGALGLGEDRRARVGGDDTARRRAAFTRFWAGMVAVLGLTMALRVEDGPNEYALQRVVPPWLGDLAILVLCGVLLERAFRRDTTAYLWAAAVGVVIALTDLNVTYLAGNTWVALLLEGLILVGVGLTAERLRRAIGALHARTGPGPGPGTRSGLGAPPQA